MFRVGDVVEIVHCFNPANRRLVGTEARVLEFGLSGTGSHSGWREDRIRLDAMGVHGDTWLPEQVILKRPPSTYDGDKVGSWDLVPWRPAVMKERA